MLHHVVARLVHLEEVCRAILAFSENPKVTGATKALVETVGGSVEIREKMSPGR
jgi:hypothetical protein